MHKVAAAAASALLATCALTAAKPVPPGDGAVAADPARDNWRVQTVAACIDTLHTVPALSPDNLESICGCAADAVLEADSSAVLPTVESGRLPAPVRSRLVMCTGRVRPERVGDVAQLVMNGPAAPSPGAATAPLATDKPVAEPDADLPAESDGGSEPGFGEWLRSLSLPAWLTGASLLWWIALGIFLFGLLILKIRRRDPRNDLMGPPSSMRRGAPLQPPRRPDLPR